MYRLIEGIIGAYFRIKAILFDHTIQYDAYTTMRSLEIADEIICFQETFYRPAEPEPEVINSTDIFNEIFENDKSSEEERVNV